MTKMKASNKRPRPGFGTVIRVKSKLVRCWKESSTSRYGSKYWKLVPLEETKIGVYIGYRTYSDGDLYELSIAAMNLYNVKSYEVWLVVLDPRQKPIAV